MSSRLGSYRASEERTPDFIIREEFYSAARWPNLHKKHLAYMDSGFLFYTKLILHDGLMLHASAVELDGGAYLFSGPSGMGKSTHANLWCEQFTGARIFNDDKPALRRLDGVWYAYGTPWCGKNGININIKTPLKAITFLKRGEENKIRRLSVFEAAAAIITQTTRHFNTPSKPGALTDLISKLVSEIPIFEFTCLPTPEAASMSYMAMSSAMGGSL